MSKIPEQLLKLGKGEGVHSLSFHADDIIELHYKDGTSQMAAIDIHVTDWPWHAFGERYPSDPHPLTEEKVASKVPMVITVRMSEELHKELKDLAHKRFVSMNQLCLDALQQVVKEDKHGLRVVNPDEPGGAEPAGDQSGPADS